MLHACFAWRTGPFTSHPLEITKKNVAVLISGSGTNLQCLIDACQSDFYHPAKISLVVSNRANAYGLTRAKIAGKVNNVIVLGGVQLHFCT